MTNVLIHQANHGIFMKRAYISYYMTNEIDPATTQDFMMWGLRM